MMMLAKNINESLTHIAIDATLDRVVNRRNTAFNFKQDVEKPLGIGVEVLPMGNEHVVAY